jgi:hypothetical protein
VSVGRIAGGGLVAGTIREGLFVAHGASGESPPPASSACPGLRSSDGVAEIGLHLTKKPVVLEKAVELRQLAVHF